MGASWGKLAGFEAGRKENAQRPSVWAGQKLKQAAAHSAPTQPTLEVFADPELQVGRLLPTTCSLVCRSFAALQQWCLATGNYIPHLTRCHLNGCVVAVCLRLPC